MNQVQRYLGLNYHKTVYQDEDGQYIVEVQELPGCVSDGATPNEAFESLLSAMTSWIQSRLNAGLTIPEPREETGYSGRILLRMPRFLHAQLAEQAEWEGVSLNQHLVTLLADGSARLGQPKAAETPGGFAGFWQNIDPMLEPYDLNLTPGNTAGAMVLDATYYPNQIGAAPRCQFGSGLRAQRLAFALPPRKKELSEA